MPDEPVSLREYVQVQLDAVNAALAEFRRVMDARDAASQKALDVALIGAKREVDTAMAAAEKAVTKFETAIALRFEGVNEFRQTLTDLVNKFQEMLATLMPRKEAEAFFQRTNARLEEMNLLIRDLATRKELAAEVARVVAENARLREDLQLVNNRVTAQEGRASGISYSRAGVMVIVGLVVGALVPIIIAVIK